MEKKSFSNTTKYEIATSEEKIKRCCAFSLLYGLLYGAETANNEILLKKTNAENERLLLKTIDNLFKNKDFQISRKSAKIGINKEIRRFSTIAEYKNNVFKCSNCESFFMRGVFLMSGTVNDPLKSYRLEFVFSEKTIRDDFAELLLENSIIPKTSTRGKTHIIYIKDSTLIEDFFAKIGATNATFQIMNSKILKEFRNNANRVANCDSANISKSIKASKKYNDAIEYLKNTDKLELLPDSLKETAILKLENKELNYAQLGEKMMPRVSKSGVFHRLEKIYDFYLSVRKEK